MDNNFVRLSRPGVSCNNSDLETRSGEDPPTPMTPEVMPGGTRPAWLARSGVELEKEVVGG